jgi:hypothetical protein
LLDEGKEKKKVYKAQREHKLTTTTTAHWPATQLAALKGNNLKNLRTKAENEKKL